ncbi:MAG: UvrD-helicase domain-containing protein [Fimbriimonadia bacterium]|jgi:ATP-dependent helicase/nuclease subunit A
MKPPRDQLERDRIEQVLDRCLLVEASAGTGKTRSMVRRMVTLLRAGECPIETLCAVTFTRKAAAELRDRFRLELYRASREATDSEADRLSAALAGLDACFIGTIHAFCARLLRERPVEAQVDPAFREIEPDEDEELQMEAWRAYAERLHATDDPLLAELSAVGLTMGGLRSTFRRFATYPDVTSWPAESVELGDLSEVAAALSDYARHMQTIAANFPPSPSGDDLVHLYRTVPRMLRSRDLTNPADLMFVLERFESGRTPTQKDWPHGKEVAKAEGARYQEFQQTIALPALERWRAHRYPVCIKTLHGAKEEYDRLRRERCVLNFQDLLLRAASLLRDKPHIRRYFRKRFTHLLVDEFQDTDPIQAEVMMLLTADDPAQQEWRHCRPVPGSLFVVGDPKQSIYRFRRADITTYEQVKKLIVAGGGEVVTLRANFRSSPEIVDWVNATFRPQFEAHDSSTSPVYTRMESMGDPDGEPAVFSVEIRKDGRKADVAEHTDRIANYVASEIGGDRAAACDFLLITPDKKHISLYSAALRAAGVPNEVTGGAALRAVPQVRLLSDLAWALAEPDNPLATLAVLRGEAFGLSDPDLFEHARAGGEFLFGKPGKTEFVKACFERLNQYADWASRYPPAVALEKALEDCGVWALAANDEDGSRRAGSIGKALALVRSGVTQDWTLLATAERLRRLAEGEDEQDAVAAVHPAQPPARVMNLHQAKGLEAEQVFLAGTGGARDHPADVHIDRTDVEPRGYIVVTEERRSQNQTLAHPSGWPQYAEREHAFLQAERTRLRYVAATRARSKLFIAAERTQKGFSKSSLWSAIHEASEGLPEMAERQPVYVDSDAEMRRVGVHEPAEAAGRIRERCEQAVKPSYESVAAKQQAVGAVWLPPSGDDTGMRWGSAIHRLLERALGEPALDLRIAATEALVEEDLSLDGLDEAVETVSAALQSDLIQRARAASSCYLEFPFSYLESEEPMPRIVRGVIDLVFREDEGWVVADYKTDAVPATGPGALVEKYGPQIRAYAAGWRQIVGEEVIEGGLYLTKTRQYVQVPLQADDS